MAASSADLGDRLLYCDDCLELLFTENESNVTRLWGQPNPSPYVKDAFHNYAIFGKHDAVNPSQTGTKAGAYYRLEVPAEGSKIVRLRLSCPTAKSLSRRPDSVFRNSRNGATDG